MGKLLNKILGRVDPEYVEVPDITHKWDRVWLRNIAVRFGWEVNQDRADQILGSLVKTQGYCPCVPKYLHGADTMCPCTRMKDIGECHCGLFITIPQAPKHKSETTVAIKSSVHDE